jgi:hypothetical protein
VTARGPGLAPEHRTTWEISRPLSTHWRRVTCEVAAQVGMCNHYAHGFALEFNPNDPELAEHRAALRTAGYRWVEVSGQNQPGFVRFEFPAEQNCLASRDQQHLIPRERTPFLRVFRGDWRANGPTERLHTNHQDFAEDLWTHVDALQTKFREG